MLNDFVIYRMIGNELWPRDRKNSKAAVFKYIFQNESNFHNCSKIWVLNRIYDMTYYKFVTNILHKYNVEYLNLPFCREDFLACKTKKDKILYFTGINEARNLALKEGRRNYTYTFVLDGDCFITDTNWDAIVHRVTEDQKTKTLENYYSFPVYRMHLKNKKLVNVHTRLFKEEPQICFHRFSDILFDANIQYGRGDKADLLLRLGFRREKPNSNYYYPDEKSCSEVTPLYHIANSNVLLEKYGDLRKLVRFISIYLLLKKLEIIYR